MKGEVRNPMTVWLMCWLCPPLGLFQLYTWSTELKNYLGREDINPVMELVFAWICMPYGLVRIGGYIQEAQQRAGMPNAEDQGVTFAIWMFICGLGWRKVQEELNKVWESGGGAPATF